MGEKIFRLLLDENRIEPVLVAPIPSWQHSDFSVCLQAGDTKDIVGLAQYLARCPFSLSRVVRISPSGQVLYRAEKQRALPFPEPVSEDLFGGGPQFPGLPASGLAR